MGRAGSVLRWLLGAALVLYLAVVGALYAFQRDLLYLPDPSRPDAARIGLPTLREVALATPDGLRLLAWYVPPPAGAPVIAYLHGNAGHIGYRAERLRRFVAEGFGVLFIEYRGYGSNPGRPTEEGLLIDARVGLDFLGASGIGPDRLVLYGESLGSGVAVRVATERPVAALVLESPYTSVAAIAQQRYPFVPIDALLKDRFDASARIGLVAAPILVLQGGHDTIVPVELGRLLFAAAPMPKKLWAAPEADHYNLASFGALDVAIDFIRRSTDAGAR
jgi:fermentation-respiration switch protein FrsA (DUF1100 family)